MTLADRIARLLEHAGHPLLAPEIAYVLRTRTYDVRRELRSDPRFSEPLCVPGRSGKARGYLLRAEVRDEFRAPVPAAHASSVTPQNEAGAP